MGSTAVSLATFALPSRLCPVTTLLIFICLAKVYPGSKNGARLRSVDLAPASRGKQRPGYGPDDSEYNCTESYLLPTGKQKAAVTVVRCPGGGSYRRARA